MVADRMGSSCLQFWNCLHVDKQRNVKTGKGQGKAIQPVECVCVYPTARPRREPAIGAHCSVPPFLLHGFIPASVSLLYLLCFPSSQRCGWHHRACLATSACVCPHWGQRARSAGRIYRSHQEHLQHDQLCILQHFVLWCCGSSCPGNCERTW